MKEKKKVTMTSGRNAVFVSDLLQNVERKCCSTFYLFYAPLQISFSLFLIIPARFRTNQESFENSQDCALLPVHLMVCNFHCIL